MGELLNWEKIKKVQLGGSPEVIWQERRYICPDVTSPRKEPELQPSVGDEEEGDVREEVDLGDGELLPVGGKDVDEKSDGDTPGDDRVALPHAVQDNFIDLGQVRLVVVLKEREQN
jgi:hypothetical protein